MAVARTRCCTWLMDGIARASQNTVKIALTLTRGLLLREPAIPVAYSLAQLRPLNAELSTAGGGALQARVPLMASLL